LLGEYKLSLVVSNDVGLSLADTVVVTADNVTGLNEIQNQAFYIYPNPTHNQFYFDAPITDHDIDIEIVDTMGRTLLTKHFDRLNNSRSISLKDHISQAGVYLVRLKSGTFIGTRRIQLIEN
ncbi:MAG TPA: T9SS type A sorting domain-containing protein, partial [Cyclobacteriaceae bacterium]